MENCDFLCCCNSNALYFEIEERERQKRRETQRLLAIHRILAKMIPILYFHTQGRWKESSERGVDRSDRAPTTLGFQIYPRNEGHPRHLFWEYHGLCLSQSYK